MAEPVLKKGSTDPAVRDLQDALKVLGHDPGPIDGILGRKARAALRQYQKDHHLPADGYPTPEMLGRLTADLAGRAS